MARRSPRKSRLPEGVFRIRLDDLAQDGRAVGHLDGKAVFVRGGLPGEQVDFRYTARRSSYDEGSVEHVERPAADRVVPRCAHFGMCGGCSLQHLSPARQIFFKQRWLLDNLSRIGKVRPQSVLDPLSGAFWGYRRKARLGVKYVRAKGRVLVGFREAVSPFVADLSRCEVLDPRVGGLLPELAELVQELSIYQRLPQIEVAAGDDRVALSFRVLDEPTDEDRAKLATFGQRHGIRIFLQPKGPQTTSLLWPDDDAGLSYRLPQFDLEMAFMPFHFTQVNRAINGRMIELALELLDLDSSERVLDLFCGLGNLTLPLARRVHTVVGVEGDKSLVAWARRNAIGNDLHNARFFAADLAGDVASEPWMGGECYDKILLDPPRSGALAMIPWIAALGACRVVYISCHPATLARDAGELVHRFGYTLRCAGVMDMFPHTSHVESIALFEKGDKASPVKK